MCLRVICSILSSEMNGESQLVIFSPDVLLFIKRFLTFVQERFYIARRMLRYLLIAHCSQAVMVDIRTCLFIILAGCSFYIVVKESMLQQGIGFLIYQGRCYTIQIVIKYINDLSYQDIIFFIIILFTLLLCFPNIRRSNLSPSIVVIPIQYNSVYII